MKLPQFLVFTLILLSTKVHAKESLEDCATYKLTGQVDCTQNSKKEVRCNLTVYKNSKSELTLEIQNDIKFISRFHQTVISVKGSVEKERAKWLLTYKPSELIVSEANNDQQDLIKLEEGSCE